MAVAEWYGQKIYFDYATGKPVAGKEVEAEEFIQVVYQDTESVGFGIVPPYVVGWYCPKASMDPDTLKTQVKEAESEVSSDDLELMKQGQLSISKVLTLAAEADA